MTKIVSIDLETLDVKTTAVILEIGIVVGDDKGNVLEQFRMYPDIQEQIDLGRSVSASTFMWWMEQPEPTRLHQVNGKRHVREEVIDEYLKFMSGHAGMSRVLGNAPSFDCDILSDYIGTKLWDFWMERDVRTAREVIPKSARYVNHAEHDALADAKAQYMDYISFLCMKP